MTQDFANRTNKATNSPTKIPGWVWFLTGLAAGIFASFLVYLSKYVPIDPQTSNIIEQPQPGPNQKTEEMQWDFYEIFPKSEVPLVEEYNDQGLRIKSDEPYAYLLQAGSFKDIDDADRLRGELILLGLDVFIKEIQVDGKYWHRVMVGPIDTDLELNRAQDKLARAEIESIPIKVSP